MDTQVNSGTVGTPLVNLIYTDGDHKEHVVKFVTTASHPQFQCVELPDKTQVFTHDQNLRFDVDYPTRRVSLPFWPNKDTFICYVTSQSEPIVD